MSEQLTSAEERMAVLQAEVAAMVDQYLEQNNQGGLTRQQENNINARVSRELFGLGLSSRDIHVNDEIVLEVGQVVPETGGLRGVKLAVAGPDGKPTPVEIYGGLPASLADVKEGDRVITVGLSNWVDIPEYGVEFGKPAWIFAKKVEAEA